MRLYVEIYMKGCHYWRRFHYFFTDKKFNKHATILIGIYLKVEIQHRILRIDLLPQMKFIV